MKMANFPFCCTMSVLGSLGEHGEDSLVTVPEIKKMIAQKVAEGQIFDGDDLIDETKRCIIASSVDPKNIRLLRAAGFRLVDTYQGVQGRVHIMTLHVS